MSELLSEPRISKEICVRHILNGNLPIQLLKYNTLVGELMFLYGRDNLELFDNNGNFSGDEVLANEQRFIGLDTQTLYDYEEFNTGSMVLKNGVVVDPILHIKPSDDPDRLPNNDINYRLSDIGYTLGDDFHHLTTPETKLASFTAYEDYSIFSEQDNAPTLAEIVEKICNKSAKVYTLKLDGAGGVVLKEHLIKEIFHTRLFSL